MRQAGGESVGKEGTLPPLGAHPSAPRVCWYQMLYWVGCGINVVSIADIFFKRVYKCLFIQKHKICFLWACTMTAVNHHALCQPIPLTETCNLFFGLFFFKWFPWSYWWEMQLWEHATSTPPPHHLHPLWPCRIRPLFSIFATTSALFHTAETAMRQLSVP